MAMKDISDVQVVEAYIKAKETKRYPYEILMEETGQPEKVCFRVMERAEERGFIEYGVSLRCGWVTEEGMKLLKVEQY